MTDCAWADSSREMKVYHDTEWGVPCHDDTGLFERLTLEIFQAGLSWETILKRRAAFRSAFDRFDFQKIAAYTEEDITRLMQDTGIIRNRLKIQSTIHNAEAVLKIREEYGSFDAYIWHFTDGAVRMHHPADMKDVPASNPLSDQIVKDMKKRGFRFIGTVIIYSFLQSVGVINDHLESCSAKYR